MPTTDRLPPKLAMKSQSLQGAKEASQRKEEEREFIRGFLERLRQIEVRMDIGCSSEWFRALDSVDDMPSLAEHIVPLQRLTSISGSAESAWIEAACKQIHRSLLTSFDYAMVWGTSVKHTPQRVGLSHVLHDEDVIQIVKKV